MKYFFVLFFLFVTHIYAQTTPESCETLYNNASFGKDCREFAPTGQQFYSCINMYAALETEAGNQQVERFHLKQIELLEQSARNLLTKPLPPISDYCNAIEARELYEELAECGSSDEMSQDVSGLLLDRAATFGSEIAESFLENRMQNTSYQCLNQFDVFYLRKEILCITNTSGSDEADAPDYYEEFEKYLTTIGRNALSREIPQDKIPRCGEYLMCLESFKTWEMNMDQSVNQEIMEKKAEVEESCKNKYTVTMSYFMENSVNAQVKWRHTEFNFAETESEIKLFEYQDIMRGLVTPTVPFRLLVNGQVPSYQRFITVGMSDDDYDRPDVIYMNPLSGGTMDSCWLENTSEGLNLFMFTQDYSSEIPVVNVDISFDMFCGIPSEGEVQMTVAANKEGDDPWMDWLGTTFELKKLPNHIVSKIANGQSAILNLQNRRNGKLTIEFTPEQ